MMKIARRAGLELAAINRVRARAAGDPRPGRREMLQNRSVSKAGESLQTQGTHAFARFTYRFYQCRPAPGDPNRRILLKRLFLLAISLLSLPSCDDDVVGDDPSNVAGRWIYKASELTGPEVTCSTSDVVLNLVRAPGSIRLDSRFEGSAFSFTMECRRDERTATLLFTEGASVVNGEIDEGLVAFDFEVPDFLHTGSVTEDSMGGTVATRLDLRQSPLSDAGIVTLIGEWTAVRD